MKKLLLACMLLATGTSSFAQWTYPTSSIISTTNSVGIGTTTPGSSLSVNPSVSGGSTPATTLMLGSGSTVLPNTAGAYLYPAEINHTYATGHNGKLQFAAYRRFVAGSGSEWQGAAYRLQYMYDATGATGANAYIEIGQSDPSNVGNGFISLGTNGADRLSITGLGNVGLSTIPVVYSGYTSLSINNASNGGYLDFQKAGVRQAFLTGDSNGLSLVSGTGTGLHLFPSGAEKLTILSNGFVGVNQNVPVANLQVGGTLITGTGAANLDPSQSTGNISFLGNYSGEMLMGWNRVKEGESDFISNRGPATGNGGFAFFDYSNTGGTTTELMRVRSTGEVLIGVTTADFLQTQSIGSNKLAVGGGIITEAVTVKMQSAGWPDYVFEPAYSLPALSKVKEYIDANRHLPEMPSEADIKKDGQNLGEINKILLKKVEELTLYMIEKDKQLAEEQHKNNEQQIELNLMQKQIEEIMRELKKK